MCNLKSFYASIVGVKMLGIPILTTCGSQCLLTNRSIWMLCRLLFHIVLLACMQLDTIDFVITASSVELNTDYFSLVEQPC